MRASAIALALLVLAGSISSAEPASAQVAPFKLLSEADLDLKKGRARDALRKYSEAHGRAPSARALRGIADARAELDDPIGASEAYRALLAEYGPRLLPQDRKKVERLQQEQASEVATLTITVGPPGAAVTLDGRPIGVAPIQEPVRVLSGRHVLRAELDEHAPGELVLEAAQGKDAAVSLTLAPLPKTGTLAVAVPSDPDAEVLVDGQVAGKGTLETELSPGEHEVRIRSPFRDDQVQTVNIPLRERVELSIDLPPPRGALAIETRPTGASITIDGVLAGRSPISVELEPGAHSVGVVHAGHRRVDASVQVVAKEKTSRTFDLPPEAAVKRVVENDHVGLYGALSLQGAFFPPLEANTIAEDCPADCTFDHPIGGGAALRAGYTFGWFGVELQGFAGADFAYGQADYPEALPDELPHFGPARTEDYYFRRIGGGGVAGVRVRTPTEVVRGLLGVGFGVAARSYGYSRDTEGDRTDRFDTYVAPTLLADLALGLGSKPGFEVQIGVWGSIDFVGDLEVAGGDPGRIDDQTYGTPSLTYARGPLFAFGPQLTFAIGE